MEFALRLVLFASLFHEITCFDISHPGSYGPIIAIVLAIIILVAVLAFFLCRSYRKLKRNANKDYDTEAVKDRENLMPTINEEHENIINNAGGPVGSWRQNFKNQLARSPSPTSDEGEPFDYAPKKSPKRSRSVDQPDTGTSQKTPLVTPSSKPAPGNLTGKTPRSIKEKDKNKKRKDSTPIELDSMPTSHSPYSTLERNSKPKQAKVPIPRPRSISGLDRARNAEDNRSRKSVTFEDDKISRKSVNFDGEYDGDEKGYGMTDHEKLVSGYSTDLYAPQQQPKSRANSKVKGFTYGLPPSDPSTSTEDKPPTRPTRTFQSSNPALNTRYQSAGDRYTDQEGSFYSSNAGRKRYGSQGDGLDDRPGDSGDRSYGGRGSASRGPDNASIYSSRT